MYWMWPVTTGLQAAASRADVRGSAHQTKSDIQTCFRESKV